MKSNISISTILKISVALMLPSMGMTQSSIEPVGISRQIDLERYQFQLEEFASQFGPMDNSLLEPLSGMLNILLEKGEFEQVAEIQNRQMSIMRANLGFENPDLIPLLRGMIQVKQVLGDWESISSHLEHIRFLIGANYGPNSEELLLAIDNQAEWLLARFYLGEERKQSDNFLNARSLYRDMHQLAEEVFGEDSPSLYPWLYKRAYNLALMVQLLNTKDGFAFEFLNDVVRADGTFRLQLGTRPASVRGNSLGVWNLRNRDFVLGEGYLRQAQGFINDIREIAEADGNEEAQAVAHIYRGDYNVLMGRNSGRRQYNEARERLLGVGISSTDLEEFFKKPMPLPIPQFYPRFDDLLAYQRSITAATDDIPEEVMHLGIFSAWHENASAVLKPISSDPLLQIGMPQYLVDLRFTVSSRGSVSSVDIINSVPDGKKIAREGVRAVREIKFRPAIEDGKAVRTKDLQMRYLFAQRLQK
jgi:hypothetical protein